MGKYFDVLIAKQGRTLKGNTFKELNAQLNPGEKLTGVYDRGLFKIAPHLYSEDEFKHFEDQYNNGFLIYRYGFYAVKE